MTTDVKSTMRKSERGPFMSFSSSYDRAQGLSQSLRTRVNCDGVLRHHRLDYRSIERLVIEVADCVVELGSGLHRTEHALGMTVAPQGLEQRTLRFCSDAQRADRPDHHLVAEGPQ